MESVPKYFAAENFHGADDDLTAEAKFFRENGYLIVDLLTDLPADWFQSLRDEIDQLLAGAHRLGDGWKAGPMIRELAVNPLMQDKLTALFGRRAFPFQTLNFRFGSQQKPHADHIHFSSLPAHFMCGVWVALEDVDIASGPLIYYPGSHKLPLLDLSDAGVAGNREIGTGEYGHHY
ncbi:MAG TPA: phytanoyl-CoA dioxygenase, partial [Rhodospirillaceae bacterium]|nr:phytanoyl-CoA dioxygenase [Rhodospirillaceae bacterium]